MAEEKLTQEELDAFPSMKGKFAGNEHLTELEKQVAMHQGLMTEDGKFTAEAIKPEPKQMPEGFAGIVALEDLAPDKAQEVEAAVQDIRGEHAEDAEIDPELQVEDGGLSAPSFSDADELPDDSDSSTDEDKDTTVDIKTLISQSQEPVKCYHCGWDQRNSFQTPKFEEEDKMAFIRHIMSKTGRFYKTYELMGGHILVTFRSRSQSEVDAIVDYTREMVSNEKLIGPADMQAQLQRFHIAASLDTLDTDDPTEPAYSFKPLDQYSNIAEMDREVFGSGRGAAFYNMITAQWMEFERLYGWFSAQAHKSDFWRAADGDLS